MTNDKSFPAQDTLIDIVDFSADAILALDDENKIVLFNAAAQTLFGYTEDEIIGKPLDILLPKNTREKHDGYLASFDEAKERSRFMANRSTVHGLTKDNELIPLDISIQKHPHARRVKYSAMCRDISKRIEAIEVLQKSEASLERAQRIAQLGNWVWDIKTGALAWSHVIYEIFERDKDSFEATYENFLECIHPEDRDAVSAAVNTAVADKTLYSIVHRVVCPSGEIKVVQEKGEVIYGDDDTPSQMDGTVQDITVSWERERALELATKQAEMSNKAKSQFLSTMSHELRTPLNAIIGMSTMINNEMFGPVGHEKYKDYVVDIKNSGYNLLDLINNVLDTANMDLQKVHSVPIEIDAKAFIKTCIQLVSHLTLTNSTYIKTIVSPELDYIIVDPNHCRKILVNLLTNAIKFSRMNGEVILTLSHDSDLDTLEFKVQDFGIGIEKGNIPNLFEPFTQSDMEFSRQYDGAGLGLSVVESLTKAQGGHVSVESEEGVGSTFTVTLPVNTDSSLSDDFI